MSSESVTNGKPAPDPYVYAADLLAVPLANCLVVENAPPGISSALAAGLKCLAVASYLPAYTLQNATRVFDTMDDLIAWFVEEHQVSRGLGVWHV